MGRAMTHLKIAIAGCFLAAAARADLDFTPRPATYQVEGLKFSQLAFSDGNKQLTYAPPAGWESFGSADRLTLRPKGKTQAEASISRLALRAPMVLDEDSVKALAAEAIASLPAGSSNAQVLQQDRNAVSINGKETLLVVVSYSLHGENYGRSIMFMPRGNEQIRFQLAAKLADFKDLQKAFFGSQFSWQGL
jgi:hypothetical protein